VDLNHRIRQERGSLGLPVRNESWNWNWNWNWGEGIEWVKILGNREYRSNDHFRMIGIEGMFLKIPYPLLPPLRPMYLYPPLLVRSVGLLILPTLPQGGLVHQKRPRRSDRPPTVQIDHRILAHLILAVSELI
jgi:hypothetical protein